MSGKVRNRPTSLLYHSPTFGGIRARSCVSTGMLSFRTWARGSTGRAQTDGQTHCPGQRSIDTPLSGDSTEATTSRNAVMGAWVSVVDWEHFLATWRRTWIWNTPLFWFACCDRCESEMMRRRVEEHCYGEWQHGPVQKAEHCCH